MSVTAMKTPGVYIQELDAFGNAVVPVPTAIPAFIGYTEKTSYNGKDLVNEPVRITSLAEFNAVFGSIPPQIQFSVNQASAPSKAPAAPAADASKKKQPAAPAAGNTSAPPPDFFIDTTGYNLATTTVNYRLYSAIRFFYENGGGTCYIVSVGGYDYASTGLTETKPFEEALTLLVKETEPTMIVIPDAVELMDPTQTDLAKKYALCYTLQGEMINHCGLLQSRVALLDIPGGYSESLVGTTSVEGFRNAVEPTLPKFNSYAAVYYPWLNTTVNQLGDISYKNIAPASNAVVQTMLNAEFPAVVDPKTKASVDNPIKPYITALFATKPAADGITQDKADSVLKNLSASYKLLLNHFLEKLNLMPPSAAMAGIYTIVDNNEGVWVAPANVGVQGVIAPSIKIDHQAQEDLNVPLDGKSVCAIRSFPGKGVLVWGARTLDGNSNDWRYINVRRTLIYIEQSVKEAASAYVFAPNDASTWVSVKSMISNFLTGLWNQGGLVGPKPADAFSVSVGLGSTMTSQDILEGKMLVAVKVAVSHPAEFIEITFQQEMQKG
ncbi:phage tail sheath C-terminal domain-containing protein [Flavivirga aquimarina]|uniref:Phage tail sheath C-terminal domain-containing protein n=1 Tax=Flavivirga aquimarina TaxID=2027862 RepID=A0ABT8W771_9FLAO|nr:phage tail sheath C-terminal domain-containing protein [Flavivirga aquimarina]MDO5968958.1 phage tail sheath C-terminal domain-containing protein [Flavivirga aquimarina]